MNMSTGLFIRVLYVKIVGRNRKRDPVRCRCPILRVPLPKTESFMNPTARMPYSDALVFLKLLN